MTNVRDVPSAASVPDSVPVLSPGRHRRPRQGACFMEFASYLAGERWSDHPQCTHPLLAFLARGVNDFTSDDGRQRLAPLIPSVIGVAGADPRIDVAVALRAAVTALPVVNETRQRTLAAGVIGCERMLIALDGRVPDAAHELVLASAHSAPLARRWASDFTRGLPPARQLSFSRQGRAIVSTAVLGVAQACVERPDDILFQMLDGAIRDAQLQIGDTRDVERTTTVTAPTPGIRSSSINV